MRWIQKYRAKACFLSIALRSFLHGIFGCSGTVVNGSNIFQFLFLFSVMILFIDCGNAVYLALADHYLFVFDNVIVVCSMFYTLLK